MQLPALASSRFSAGLRAVLDNRQLRRLELASLVWNTAEQVYLVGFLVFAFAAGGSGGVALAGLLQAAPSVVLLPGALRLTARFRPDDVLRALIAIRTIAIALAAVAATAAGTAAAAPAAAPYSALVATAPAALVFAFAAVDALAAGIARPVRAALVPHIARSPQELVAANVSISTGRSLASLVGPALAAILLASRDSGATLAVAAVLFGGSLAIGLSVRPVIMPSLLPAPGASARRGGSRAALAALGRLRHPRLIVGLIVAQQVVRGMLPVLLVSLAIGVLGAGDQAVGLLSSAIGLGGLIGGAVSIAALRRLRLATALAVAMALWGIGILVPGLAPGLVVAAASLAVGGIGKSMIEVASVTLLQRTVPNLDRPGVFGLLESLVALGVAFGAVLAAGLVAIIGVTGALVVAGAGTVVVAIASWPALRTADDAAVVPEEELRLLRGVPMLRPLTMCTTEDLAARARRVHVPAGEILIRQGDVGDAFYILESGAMEAEVHPTAIRMLEPGDSFGEIALLRDIPRTATVRATKPSVVMALDRDAFVTAVSGRQEAAAAAESVIRDRLGA